MGIRQITSANSAKAFLNGNEELVQLIVNNIKCYPNKRLVFISSNMIHVKNSLYGRSKMACELIIRSGLKNYLILRPGPIYGRYIPEKNSTIANLAASVLSNPFVIAPGFGNIKVEPVFFDDLYIAIKANLNSQESKVLDFDGEQVTLRQIISLLGNCFDKRPTILPLPLTPFKLLSKGIILFCPGLKFPADRINSIGEPILKNSESLCVIKNKTGIKDGIRYLCLSFEQHLSALK